MIRSHRKSLGLTIERDGSVILRAPVDCPDAAADTFFQEKKFWIYQKLAEKRLHEGDIPVKEYVNGEGFEYLGRTYQLVLVDSGPPLRLYRGRFEMRRDCAKKGKEVFIAWYKEHAEKIIRERIQIYQPRISDLVKGIRVMDLKYRWGSCTSKHNLNFHWKMILTPMRIVDYIIVHELTHMIEKNHTPAFWHNIGLILPDYEVRKEWLDKNGKKIEI